MLKSNHRLASGVQNAKVTQIMTIRMGGATTRDLPNRVTPRELLSGAARWMYLNICSIESKLNSLANYTVTYSLIKVIPRSHGVTEKPGLTFDLM